MYDKRVAVKMYDHINISCIVHHKKEKIYEDKYKMADVNKG